jgi:hypothetical protein
MTSHAGDLNTAADCRRYDTAPPDSTESIAPFLIAAITFVEVIPGGGGSILAMPKCWYKLAIAAGGRPVLTHPNLKQGAAIGNFSRHHPL